MASSSAHEKQREPKTKYVCGLKNVQAGTRLNVYNGKTCGWADGGEVRDQIWFLQPAGDNENGPFMITSNLTYKHVVAKGPYGVVELSDGSPNDSEAQWNLVPVGSNFSLVDPRISLWCSADKQCCSFTSVRFSNCVLDLAAGLTHNGVDIYCWPSHGGQNQQWTMIKY
ncbi:uncharacterized protein K460DRAFT_358049 [Cucurbitaria berberidis CBS 394.84]|uniref:Carbohydrate-binding module family 13 protein n=1 Tax=Cucurbitaria berberidis CBS 394.84 TaxID=1168544 RepID=A0A9P4GFK0_9PLEO|nr:uncharacterized protein K460DRAFT_358049 [Cucurbitaria berberidis CBS 394.84]KAF1844452.1 hypothetical protein K460DRAFT_358049 [Cucurbitaria berberidis CBS 394.84]